MATSSVHANVSPAVQALPYELFAELLGYLSLKELIVATHVCSSWRNTAVGTPTLWTSLLHPPVKAISTLIQRARDSPVRLMSSVTSRALFVSLCSDVEDHMSSFRYLSIHVRSAQPVGTGSHVWDWKRLWQALHRPAPNLEELALYSLDLTSVFPRKDEIEFFRGDAPKLRTLTLCGFEPRPGPPVPVAMSFAQVTSLSATEDCFSQLNPLDAYFPNLVDLFVSDIVTFALPPLCLSSLRNVSLMLLDDPVARNVNYASATARWLTNSRIESIPHFAVILADSYSDINMQRCILLITSQKSQRLCIYATAPNEYRLSLGDVTRRSWRVLGNMRRMQVEEHILVASMVSPEIIDLSTNKLDILTRMDPKTVSNITSIEVPVPGKCMRGRADLFDIRTFPVFHNVTAWSVSGVYEFGFDESEYDSSVDSSDVVEFAKHAFPRLENVYLEDIGLLDIDELSQGLSDLGVNLWQICSPL